jgi:hypothetical protein|tara:strand:- start:587 stop:1390 length:804 start_codon:yes stop_codon:yes gene_type:complete
MGLAHSPSISQDGLLFAVDAANPRCYSGAGTSANDLLLFGPLPVNQPVKLRPNSVTTDNNQPQDPVAGTLTNGVGFTSENGGAFTFDGTDDYIVFNSETLNPGFPTSMLCWFKIDQNSSAQGLFSLRWHSTRYYGFFVNINASAKLSMQIGDGGSAGSGARRTGQRAAANVDTGRWYHGAFVWNDLIEDMVMYIDGEPQTLTYSGTGDKLFYGAASTATDPATWPQRIGVLNDKYLDGSVAQILFYGRALTKKEILNHYEATKKRFI